MVLVWMACLTTNLQLHERRRHRSFHHGANCIYLWFFSMFWALCLLFIRVIQRPAALRRRSSPSKNVFLWKVFPGCVTGRPHSTTQPSGQCSNLSCPQRAWTQKKKKTERKDRNSPSWSDWPRQSEQAAAQKQQTLSAGRIWRSCVRIRSHV